MEVYKVYKRKSIKMEIYKGIEQKENIKMEVYEGI